MLIKIKDTDTKIKLKTVSNLAKITGRRWWLHLDPTTLLHLKKNEHSNPSIETKPISERHTYNKDPETPPKQEIH